MTLEDFFTVTEMKDGLTALARVKELINVMQKDEHNIVKNVGNAIRQRSTVARTIAATESKECLALFLQLEGLCYFNTWLKDGQKFFNETGDSFVEESMTALLGAIEKMHIDGQKSVPTGIMMTVKDLLINKSSRIQDRARALFDSWKQNDESNVVHKDVEKDDAVSDDLVDVNGNPVSEHALPECSSQHISTSGGFYSEEKNVEPATDEMTPAISPETAQPEEVADLTIRPSSKSLDHASIQEGSPDPARSDTLKLISENNSVLENSPKHRSEAIAGIESSGSAVPEQRTLEGQLDVADSNEHDDAKQMPQIRSCNNLGGTDTSFCADSTNTVESKVGANNENDVDGEKEDPCPKIFSSGDDRKEESEGKDEMCDNRSPNPCIKISASDSTAPVDEYNVDVLQVSSVSEHSLGKDEGLTTNLSIKVDTEAIEESDDQNDTDEDEVDSGNDYDFSMSGVDVKDYVDKKSDFELDYGLFDPLEVARQVAIEVKREVDCREPSCSSSEKTSGGGIRLPESPDYINGKNSRVMHHPFKDVSTGLSISAVVGDKAFGVSEVAQKTEPDEDKRGCGFDLNEEVLSDDMDHQINPVTAPISVVYASRAAAASELPLSPLQFEGTLGWKGSAETSAFRPAPTRKVSEGANSVFASGSSSNLFQRREYLDFDLNLAEGEDDRITDLPLSKEIPNSTGRPSGNCSLEVDTKSSDLLQLDLNRVSDGGDAPLSYWRKETRVLPHWNDQFSPSPSSSSSSMQPSLKNIDLNDLPSLITDFLNPALTGKSSPNLCTSGSGGSKTNESVISLLGTRVEVNGKDNIPQIVPLLNGRIVDPALGSSMTRKDSVLGLASSSLYAQSSMYGYNGTSYGHNPALGSSITRNDSVLGLASSSLYAQSSMYGYNDTSYGHTVPCPTAMYGFGGQIPYMVDSRGTPVVPQVFGPVAALPPFSQPSFITNLAGAPSDSNGFVPSKHGLDLNSGLLMEGGNRDAGSIRQLFNPGQGISIDEQMRANSQSTSSSGVGGKRKETDGGWDPYTFTYKHPRPPWK